MTISVYSGIILLTSPTWSCCTSWERIEEEEERMTTRVFFTFAKFTFATFVVAMLAILADSAAASVQRTETVNVTCGPPLVSTEFVLANRERISPAIADEVQHRLPAQLAGNGLSNVQNPSVCLERISTVAQTETNRPLGLTSNDRKEEVRSVYIGNTGSLMVTPSVFTQNSTSTGIVPRRKRLMSLEIA